MCGTLFTENLHAIFDITLSHTFMCLHVGLNKRHPLDLKVAIEFVNLLDELNKCELSVEHATFDNKLTSIGLLEHETPTGLSLCVKTFEFSQVVFRFRQMRPTNHRTQNFPGRRSRYITIAT